MTTVAKGAVEMPATGRATSGLVTWTATGVAHSAPVASRYRKWGGADGGGSGGKGGADGTAGSTSVDTSMNALVTGTKPGQL